MLLNQKIRIQRGLFYRKRSSDWDIIKRREIGMVWHLWFLFYIQKEIFFIIGYFIFVTGICSYSFFYILKKGCNLIKFLPTLRVVVPFVMHKQSIWNYRQDCQFKFQSIQISPLPHICIKKNYKILQLVFCFWWKRKFKLLFIWFWSEMLLKRKNNSF